MTTENTRGYWAWIGLCLGLLAVMFAATSALRTGPSLDSLDFDAERAMATLRELIPDNRPHPTGSAENTAVADRITRRFEALGLSVERRSELSCTSFGAGCTRVENLVAVLEGTGEAGDDGGRDTLLLMSHYDSVAAAPGAADALSGIAVILETAAAMVDEGPWRNDVIFLATDGEETGLRGALAFARHHPLASTVDLAINLEARGADGASALFETSAGNAALVQHFADSVARPAGSSLLVEVYRRMPNNTDLTVLLQDGVAGMNFAYSRAGSLYHTVRDDTDHLSLNALGHHGDNLLGLAQTFANEDLSALSVGTDATYVDLFSRGLLAWPSAWNLPLAVFALVVLVVMYLRAPGGSPGRIGRVLLAGLGLFVLAPLAGWLLTWPLAKWPATHLLDHPYPAPGNIALFAAAVLAGLLVATTLARRLAPITWLYGAWLVYALLGVVLAVTLPGTSYLTLLPLAAFLLPLWPELKWSGRGFPTISALCGATVAAYLAVYHFIVFYALGSFHASALRMAPLALFILAVVPLARQWAGEHAPRRTPLLATLALVVVAAIVGAVVPAETPERPRWANLVLAQPVGATAPGWQLNTYGIAHAPLATAMGFEGDLDTVRRPHGRDGRVYTRPASEPALAVPVLERVGEIVEGDTRRVILRIAGVREGHLMFLAFDDAQAVSRLVVGDTDLVDPPRWRGLAGFSGLGNEALELEVTLPVGQAVTATLTELSPLPDSDVARQILDTRPDTASPVQFGDHAEAATRIEL